MQVKTRLFGDIDIADSKVICLAHGLIGYPDMKKYTLIFDEEKKDRGAIMWLQSLDEPDFAMPVMMPQLVAPDYAPCIDEDFSTHLADTCTG